MIEREVLDSTFYFMSQTEYASNIGLAVLGILFACVMFGWVTWAVLRSYEDQKNYMATLTDKEYRHCDKVRRM